MHLSRARSPSLDFSLSLFLPTWCTRASMPCQSTVQHKKRTVKNEINLQTTSWAMCRREEGRGQGGGEGGNGERSLLVNVPHKESEG